MPYNKNAYKTRAEREQAFTWAKTPVAYIDSTELGLCSEGSRWYYVALTLLAVSLDGDGHIFHSDGLLDKSLKEIAWRLRTDVSMLNMVFEELSNVGLVERRGEYYRLVKYTAEQINQQIAKNDQDHKRELNAARQAEWRKNHSSKEPFTQEGETEEEVEIEEEEEVEGNALRNALRNSYDPPPIFANEHSQAVYTLCQKIGWGKDKSIEAAEKRTSAAQYHDFLDLLSKKGNPVAHEELKKIHAAQQSARSTEVYQLAVVDTELTRRLENFTPRRPSENIKNLKTA